MATDQLEITPDDRYPLSRALDQGGKHSLFSGSTHWRRSDCVSGIIPSRNGLAACFLARIDKRRLLSPSGCQTTIFPPQRETLLVESLHSIYPSRAESKHTPDITHISSRHLSFILLVFSSNDINVVESFCFDCASVEIDEVFRSLDRERRYMRVQESRRFCQEWYEMFYDGRTDQGICAPGGPTQVAAKASCFLTAFRIIRRPRVSGGSAKSATHCLSWPTPTRWRLQARRVHSAESFVFLLPHDIPQNGTISSPGADVDPDTYVFRDGIIPTIRGVTSLPLRLARCLPILIQISHTKWLRRPRLISVN